MRGLPPHPAGIRSPCVRDCCLDDDDICLGCGRAIAEIIGWSGATDTERQAILRRAGTRLEQKGRIVPR